MSGWILFLDDERHPARADKRTIVCRSSVEALAAIRERGCPQVMLLDHDLGSGDDATAVFYPGFETLALDGEISIPDGFEVYIHSQNSVGGPYLAAKIRCLAGEMRRRAELSRISSELPSDTAKAEGAGEQ